VADLFYVHWDEAEALQHAANLSAAGHRVRTHARAEDTVRLGERTPDAVVISLDRLPSHGRAVAEWLWQAKKRQSIPLVFVGGRAEKVEAMRERFPAAVFCARERLRETLAAISR
jgi:DNA-binding response OmpR family regulator